jgi:hypothetical protein
MRQGRSQTEGGDRWRGGKRQRGVGRGETEVEGGPKSDERSTLTVGTLSPSLIKVVKRRGKLVVGRVEGDPRCLVGFCLWPV